MNSNDGSIAGADGRVLRRTSTTEFERHLPHSGPLLTSSSTSWPHMLLRTFVVPGHLEHDFVPGTPDPYITVLVSGTVRVARRAIGARQWEEATLRPGAVALTSADHCFEIRLQAQTPETIESLHLHLLSSRLVAIAEELTGRDGARVEILDRLAADDPLIAHLALALRAELQGASSGDSSSRLFAESVVHTLAVQLLRRHSTCVGPIREVRGGLGPGRLRRTIERMRLGLDSDLSLAELARECGLSVFHFARMFHISTGRSPHSFMVQLRLDEARRLLRETHLGIDEIAQRVGYQNASHFAAQFRRHNSGVRPSEYRRLNG